MKDKRKKNFFMGEDFLFLIKKMSCAKKLLVSDKDNLEKNPGWKESEEEYQKRQALWLESLKKKKP